MACEFYLLPNQDCCIDLDTLRENIKEWFDFDPGAIRCVAEIPQHCETIIATAWNTARYVSLQSAHHKLYFVQDYEPLFYPMGDDYIGAKSSYKLGLFPVTIGRWLSQKMEQFAGQSVPYIDFGVNNEVYHPAKGICREHAICAIYQPDKSRRLARLLENSLDVIQRLDPTLKMYVFGSDDKGFDLDSVENLGLLSVEQCAELYRRCEIGLCFSATNPSRVPFEMMACGLPVIDIEGDNTSLDFPQDAVRLVDPHPVSIAMAVLALEKDSELRASMGKAGVAYGDSHPLMLEGQQFIEGVAHWQKARENGDEEPLDTSQANAKMIWTECLKEEYQAFARWEPLCCDAIAIMVDPIPADTSLPPLRAACWTKPDQSDLQWVDLKSMKEWMATHRRGKALRFLQPQFPHEARIGLVTLSVDRAQSCEMSIHLYTTEPCEGERFCEGYVFEVNKPRKRMQAKGFVERRIASLGAILSLRAQ